MNNLPNSEIIIIGGGAIGLGCAHALAKAGKTDILLIERADAVGQVTTSQGAGLCGQVRDAPERTRLAMHSVSVFRDLQKSEVKPDWHEVGSLRIALSERRAEEFRRLQQVADEAGLEASLLNNAQAKCLWPLMDFAHVKAVLWCPSDGWMTPSCVAGSYEDACRQMGVRFVTSTFVEEVTTKEGRVAGVRTNRGAADCQYVVNAAGAHAYHIAKLVGLELPIVPVRHEYFVTVAVKGLGPELPCFRIPELTLYGRVRDQGLLLGGWEPRSLHTDPRTYALGGDPPGINPDWTVLKDFAEKFKPFFPTA